MDVKIAGVRNARRAGVRSGAGATASHRAMIERVRGLSKREIQVLRLMGYGYTLTAIAKRLQLSPKTVSSYRSRILGKLGLQNTSQLIRFAIVSGISPVEETDADVFEPICRCGDRSN